MTLSTLKQRRLGVCVASCLAVLVLTACSKQDASAASAAPAPAASAPKAMDAAAMKAAGIRVAKVQLQLLEGQLRAPGEVLEDTYGTTLITPRVPALVIKRHAKLGDHVLAGTPLVTLSSIDVADAQASLQTAEQEWTRIQALGRDLVSGRRYDEARVAVGQARAKARAYGMPGTAAGHANGEFTLTAPHAGRLTQDDFIVGQQIEPGQALFRLVDESKVWVDAKVSSEASQSIVVGSQALIVVGDMRMQGTVMQRGHRTAEDTRTALVRIEVPNTNDRLHGGDLVETLLNMQGASSQQVAVHTDALTQLQGQTVAFKRNAEGVLEPVPVETGATVGDATVITAGLQDGDHIAISGIYALKSRLLRSQLGDND